MKEQIVTHPGFVKSIESNRVEFVISSVDRCASCQLKGACCVREWEEKQVWVKTDDTSSFRVGQQVTIEMKQSLGTWAVLLGYVFPFFVLLLVLILFISLGFDQGLSGLIALGALVPYYTTLYILRHRLDSRFQYSLRT